LSPQFLGVGDVFYEFEELITPGHQAFPSRNSNVGKLGRILGELGATSAKQECSREIAALMLAHVLREIRRRRRRWQGGG
jgi:hypothetical protein